MNERNDKFNQEQHVSQHSACANILLEMAAVSILIAWHYSCHHQAASGSFISTCFLIPVAILCLTPLKSAELQSCESFSYTPRSARMVQYWVQTLKFLGRLLHFIFRVSLLWSICISFVIFPVLNRLINYDYNIRKLNKSCIGFSCVRPQDRKDSTNTNTLGEQCRNDALWHGNWAGSQKTLIINTSRAPKCHKSFRSSTH